MTENAAPHCHLDINTLGPNSFEVVVSFNSSTTEDQRKVTFDHLVADYAKKAEKYGVNFEVRRGEDG